ncbi:MAG: molybdopterin-binding protein [Candidatus Limnocylindrales bacterium]|jgi:molybdopterin-binding protein
MSVEGHPRTTRVRIGQAAEMLNVSIDTLRRWELEGRLATERSVGGQRMIAIADVARLLRERRTSAADRPVIAQSARSRLPAIVTNVSRNSVTAVIEMAAGSNRLVSLLTAEAADELGLVVGARVVAVIKATDVLVELEDLPESSS